MSLCQHSEIRNIIPIVKMRKLGSEKRRELPKVPMARKWQSWSSNSGSLFFQAAVQTEG